MKKILTVATLLAGGAVHAAGFALDTHNARAVGMGTAVTGSTNDASAIFYNAAGIVGPKGGEKLDLQIGDTAIFPKINFKNAETGNTTSTEFGVSPPPHLFGTYQIVDDLAVGVGVFVPFGASAKWPEGWEKRFNGLRSNLTTYDINPTIAYKFADRVRVGAGVNIVRGTVEIERNVDSRAAGSEANVRLGGAAWGVGGNAGVQVDLLKDVLMIGAQYRTQVEMNFKGAADFTNQPAILADRFRDQDITADIVLPSSVTVGLAGRPMPELLIGFDVGYTHWSSFPELAIKFPEDPTLNNPLRKEWKNVVRYNVGAEYALRNNFAVRVGGGYDPSPSPATTLTPDLPDSDRIKGSVGAGYALQLARAHQAIHFDLAYQYTALLEKESTAPDAPGTYSGLGHVVSLTLGYRM